ncbi:unnamed protein product [Arctia plantaginis]|uniref:Uncharacterized protein n=1 Tax=Arctia plantaginis TaxID=874455 RepID=A0A8S1ADD0_ARCPL|nr:unnamed protein product [Arctia plantaginis]
MKKTQVDIDDADDCQQNDITEKVVNEDSTQHCDNDQETDTYSEQYHEMITRTLMMKTQPKQNKITIFLETDQQYNCHNGMMSLYWQPVSEVQNLPKDPVTYKQALDSPYKEKWFRSTLDLATGKVDRY